ATQGNRDGQAIDEQSSGCKGNRTKDSGRQNTREGRSTQDRRKQGSGSKGRHRQGSRNKTGSSESIRHERAGRQGESAGKDRSRSEGSRQDDQGCLDAEKGFRSQSICKAMACQLPRRGQ